MIMWLVVFVTVANISLQFCYCSVHANFFAMRLALGGATVDCILVTAFVHVQAIAAIFLFTVIKYKIILEIYEYATTKDFYPRDAMLARVIVIATCPSVRPSVRLSRAGIVSKRRKLVA